MISRNLASKYRGILAPPVKERCTVHASPDCLDPDGPTYSGSGWNHDGTDQRIECSVCTKAMTS